MHCNTCGSDVAARIKGWWDTKTNQYQELCDLCSDISAIWLPDVYLGTKGGIQTDENLVHPKTGQPLPFQTKREKAAIMKMLNVRQSPSAEHQHGGRNETKKGTKYFF